ncbi:polysaccharide biosynthesis tyrosine autokinase [Verrucomicrobia bacterium]|nr:polysaccharide biosynthesis tyrosine autokinase [Verrucomicrobiota bacterium]
MKTDPLYQNSVDIALSVANSVNIKPIRLTQLMSVGIEHTDPKQAARIANTLVDEFIKLNKETKIGKLSDLHFYLEEEVQSTKENLNVARQTMQDYRVSQGTVSLEKDQDIGLQALIQAQSEYTRAESEDAIARSVAEEMKAQLAAGKPLETIPQIAANPQIAALQQTLAGYEAELQGLLVRYKEGWPMVRDIRKRIESLKQSLSEAAEDALKSTILAAEQAHAKLQKLTQLVQDRETAHLSLNEQRIKYDIESRNAEQLRELYNTLLSRLEEVRIAQRSHTSNISFVDRAEVPFEPVKPRVVLTLLLSVFGGLILGSGVALFVNFLDDSIKSQEDVESYLGLTFLGYVARIKGTEISERGQESFVNPQSVASESFRTLRATITLLPNGNNYRTIAVSSTKSGEGKSLATSNLAIVCAQAGTKTLLIDADLRRPTIHEIYKLPNSRGLADYLSNTKQFEDIVQQGTIPNLEYITSGPIPGNPSELLSGNRFTEFLNEARNRYERIIIDCPPVSAVSDPLSVASRCDGILFISRFNKIRREHARRTVQRLKEAGVQTIGGLINDISAENSHSYYYYSDYYYKPYKADVKEAPRNDTPKKQDVEAEVKVKV